MKFKFSILLLIAVLFLSCNKDNEKETILSLSTLQIDNISNITTQTAHIVSNITDDGNSNINSRGVCWSKEENPSIDNFIGITDNNQGLGIYISEVSDLEENTQYYICAYAVNEKGVAYSEILSFTTKSLLLANVNTKEAFEITATSAKIKGELIDDGNSNILIRGFCWNKSGNPTLQNNIAFTEESGGSVEFESDLSNLENGTIYFVCAYALNEKGHSYGNIVQFSTLEMSLPVIETKSCESITKTSAVSGGHIISDGNTEIISKGVCWSKYGIPTYEHNVGFTTNQSEDNDFISNITELDSISTYQLRAYVINEMGISYGELLSFKTLGLSTPIVITLNVTNITGSDATCKGEIIEDGGTDILTKGFCWSINVEPTLENNIGYTNEGPGSGNYDSSISNLIGATTYQIRAYASNSTGTSYGDAIIFTTVNNLTVSSLYEEFNDAIDNEDISIPSWTNILVTGNRKWFGKVFDDEKYANMTSYNMGSNELETWLVTPIIENISAKYLRIKTSQAYWTHPNTSPLTVMISMNFNGLNYDEATWYELNILTATSNNPDWQWIDSGVYSLSEFSGNAAIAFIYRGNYIENTTIRLDDIEVQEQ